jgi:hypothetical protein
VTIGINAATTSVVGAVQLSDSTSTTSSVLASTPTATKSAYDLADAAIAKSTVTTAGDIIYRNATVPARLGIGTAGQVLKVNSGATAPEWGAAASGLTLINRTVVTAQASQSFNNVFSSTYENYLVTFNETAATTNGVLTYLRFRASGTDATANYYYANSRRAFSTGATGGSQSSGAGEIQLVYTETGKQGNFNLNFNAPQQAQWTCVTGLGTLFAETYSLGAQLQDTTAYDGFTVYVTSGTFTGIISIYGLAKA